MRGSGTGGGDTKQAEWELYDLDKYIGTFSTEQILKLTGMSYSNLIHRIGTGQCKMYKKRWRMQRVSEPRASVPAGETWADWWTEEWGQVVEALRGTGYDLGRVKIMQRRNGGGAGGTGKRG